MRYFVSLDLRRLLLRLMMRGRRRIELLGG
jgi:hypothetical protein